MARSTALGLALLVTLAGSGCADREVRYQIALSGELPASVSPIVRFDGATLPLERLGSDRWLARYRARKVEERLSRRLGELKVALPTPCGDHVAAFRPADPGFDGEAGLAAFRSRLREEEELVAPRGQVAQLGMALGVLKLPPALTLTVDWRGAPTGARVRLGRFELRRGAGLKPPRRLARPWTRPRGFAASDAELFRVFAPDCAAGRVIHIGERPAGALPPLAGDRSTAVIDVTGEHCYRAAGAEATTQPTSMPLGHVKALAEGPPAAVIETPFPHCPRLAKDGRACATILPCDQGG